MHTITARNVQQALPRGLFLLRTQGIRETSRVGDVLRFPGPVATVLGRPQERVIFHTWRDANPFFHIVEAAWMLAGRDDLKQLTPYVKKMAEFSDDGGKTQPGAYGKRWRGWFSSMYRYDQLNWAVKRLRANPNDRRVVIQMWDASHDPDAADRNSADVPCNLTMLPWMMDGALHLTIFNRSNDIVWGLYGANAVHFSVVLEYLAGRLGLPVGTMTTISNNFHGYVDKVPELDVIRKAMYATADPYTDDAELVQPYTLMTLAGYPATSHDGMERIMQEDLATFFEVGAIEALQTARWPWVRRVLAPMALAHQRFKGPRAGRYEGARSILGGVAATDWRRAALEWVQRREDAARETTRQADRVLDES